MTADATRSEDVPVRERWWVRSRWAALAAVVVSMLAGVLSTPLPAEEDDLKRDLADGAVAAVSVGHASDYPSDFRFRVIFGEEEQDGAPVIRWVTKSQVYFEAPIHMLAWQVQNDDLSDADIRRNLSELREDEVSELPGDEFLDDPLDDYRVPERQRGQEVYSVTESLVKTVDATARSHGRAAPRHVAAGGFYRDFLRWIPLVVWLTFVGLLVMSSQPRRFTKWGTFWLLGLPGSVGMLWWVLRDSPWSRAINTSVEEPTSRYTGGMRDRDERRVFIRRGGWRGFAVWVIGGIVLSTLLSALASSLGYSLHPDLELSLPDEDARWLVVRTDGSSATRG